MNGPTETPSSSHLRADGTDEFIAEFERRFPSGVSIAARLRMPLAGFRVTTLFGPSGCGKTTILRCLAGLDRPSAGTIASGRNVWFDSTSQVCLSPQQRDVGFLFQDYALFPHLTIAENVGFGLRPDQRSASVAELMSTFDLTGLERRLPDQISGGQQQRVALARVLARRPRLLLLDEPLSALDAVLREQLRTQLRRQLAVFQIPVVLVTHDRTEAIALSDELIVMESGRIRQTGTVEEVISRPNDLSVARIVGVETVVLGTILSVQDGLATVQVGSATLLAVAPTDSSKTVHVCIRGEDVAIQKGPVGETSVRNRLPAVILSLIPEGPLVRVHMDCGFELTALVTRPACDELQLRPGDRVTASLKAPAIHLIAAR